MKWIGANGRKWRGQLRNLEADVLRRVAKVLGVSGSDKQHRRLPKEKLWEAVYACVCASVWVCVCVRVCACE